jgi:hypothetical protein
LERTDKQYSNLLEAAPWMLKKKPRILREMPLTLLIPGWHQEAG